jgi:hypothetical protein
MVFFDLHDWVGKGSSPGRPTSAFAKQFKVLSIMADQRWFGEGRRRASCHSKVGFTGPTFCRLHLTTMSTSFPSLSHTPQLFPLPSIAEDTLHYTLHLPPKQEQNSAALALLITEYVESLLLQPWLWNKDSWELKVISESGESEEDGARLEGRMRVGDAVDDEWLVVYLLKEVSKRWPELIIG